MPTESRRRKSLERYHPKQRHEKMNSKENVNNDDVKNGDDHDKIEKQMRDMKLEEQPRKTNQRRSINNHLFGNTNNTREHGRGRGRGRGRGSTERINKGFDEYNIGDKESFKREKKHNMENEKWRCDFNQLNYNRNDEKQFKFVYNDEQFEHKSITPFDRQNNKHSPRKKNTETFKPSHKPVDMRILTAHAGWKRYLREMTSRDVLVIYDVFCAPDDLTIYNKLLREIETCGVDLNELWQSWHGDSHVIADDKKRWKESCPTFHMILDQIRDYFQMDIKATRLNWYRDSNEWKPFHHDAAAIKPDKAKTQNFTVAVSFGAERDAAFEHATTKAVISMPQPNGTIYTFGKDVNVIWRHGILQVPPENFHDRGRISIIAWGWAQQTQL